MHNRSIRKATDLCIQLSAGKPSRGKVATQFCVRGNHVYRGLRILHRDLFSRLQLSLLFERLRYSLDVNSHCRIVANRTQRTKQFAFSTVGIDDYLHTQQTVWHLCDVDLFTKISANLIERSEDFDLEFGSRKNRRRGERESGRNGDRLVTGPHIRHFAQQLRLGFEDSGSNGIDRSLLECGLDEAKLEVLPIADCRLPMCFCVVVLCDYYGEFGSVEVGLVQNQRCANDLRGFRGLCADQVCIASILYVRYSIANQYRVIMS